jgi:preprotein translocase subunit SecG
VSALLTLVHVIVCLILVVAVLLQSGKAADLAGAFGGVGSQTAFGPRGTATLFSKMTTICAVLFMFTSLGLWILSSSSESKSALRGEKAAPVKQESPAAATTTESQKNPNAPAAGEQPKQEPGQKTDASKDVKK